MVVDLYRSRSRIDWLSHLLQVATDLKRHADPSASLYPITPREAEFPLNLIHESESVGSLPYRAVQPTFKFFLLAGSIPILGWIPPSPPSEFVRELEDGLLVRKSSLNAMTTAKRTVAMVLFNPHS
jgi:hypothetical protein